MSLLYLIAQKKIMNKTHKLIPPVIKWSGSKRPIAYQLSRLFPKSNHYFDPFVGGGAILPFFQEKPSTVGDIIPELISLWSLIKNEPNKLKVGYSIRWNKLQNQGYTAYYEIRSTFNKTKDPIDFLFLSRTCVNGLIRYNNKGEFNNSLHHTRPGIHPDRLGKIIDDWSKWVQNIEFHNQDYRKTLSGVKNGDTVFLDPPYVGTKARYMPQTFSYDDFFGELDRLNKIGAYWILTLDGEAGNRLYDSKIPKDLYKRHLKMSTGKSPFSKVINNKDDNIIESVYLNFEPSTEVLDTPLEERFEPLTIFS